MTQNILFPALCRAHEQLVSEFAMHRDAVITFFNLIVQAIFFFLFFQDVMLDRQRFSTKNQVQ